MSPCHPVSMTFDPYINGLYMTCVEDIDSSGDKKRYHIRKKTFDEKINQAIYNAPQSVFACLLFIVLCNPIVDIPNQSCVTVSATFQVALCINQRTVREPRACLKACYPYHSQPDLWNAVSMLFYANLNSLASWREDLSCSLFQWYNGSCLLSLHSLLPRLDRWMSPQGLDAPKPFEKFIFVRSATAPWS